MPKEICMLAHLYDPKRVIFPAYIQPKLDGIRVIWKHKEKQFVSRKNKPLILPAQLYTPLYTFPFDIDGELTAKGKSFNEISGIVRHQDMIPEKVLIQYTVFDCMTEMPFKERYDMLSSSLRIVTSYTCIQLLRTDIVPSFKALAESHRIILENKYEGSIIRNNTLYEFKRSYNLLKLKPTKEIICRITGLIEGTGKYENMLGALTVKTSDGKLFNVGSGFTDEDRDCIWFRDAKPYENKFVRIKYQDLSEYGIPRFPIFKGFV